MEEDFDKEICQFFSIGNNDGKKCDGKENQSILGIKTDYAAYHFNRAEEKEKTDCA